MQVCCGEKNPHRLKIKNSNHCTDTLLPPPPPPPVPQRTAWSVSVCVGWNSFEMPFESFQNWTAPRLAPSWWSRRGPHSVFLPWPVKKHTYNQENQRHLIRNFENQQICWVLSLVSIFFSYRKVKKKKERKKKKIIINNMVISLFKLTSLPNWLFNRLAM